MREGRLEPDRATLRLIASAIDAVPDCEENSTSMLSEDIARSEGDCLSVALLGAVARAHETVGALADKMSRADLLALALGVSGHKPRAGGGNNDDAAAEWVRGTGARSGSRVHASRPLTSSVDTAPMRSATGVAAAAAGPGSSGGAALPTSSGAAAPAAAIFQGVGVGGAGSSHPSGDEDAAMAMVGGAAAGTQVGTRRKREQ